MITTLKTSFGFEHKMPVAMDSAGATATPEGFAPELGVLAWVPYKPAKMRYVVRLSSQPTTGQVIIKMKAGSAVVGQTSVAVTGLNVFSGAFDVNLSGIGGNTPIAAEIEVTSEADAGITGEMDAALDIEQPLQVGNC